MGGRVHLASVCNARWRVSSGISGLAGGRSPSWVYPMSRLPWMPEACPERGAHPSTVVGTRQGLARHHWRWAQGKIIATRVASPEQVNEVLMRCGGNVARARSAGALTATPSPRPE